MKFVGVLLLSAFYFVTFSSSAWDYEGHRWVNQLALETLPEDFPSFVRKPKAAERIAFLAGEPDRWRNSSDQSFKHASSPDHFLDIEYLEDHGLKLEGLSHFRYEFAVQLSAGRIKNPDKVEPIDPAKNEDKTRELIGFLPWSITEQYAKLKSAFSYLKAYEEAGTKEEIANARQNVIYIMGVLGHYVGDAAQPLHSTKHFNGWVGENPKGYSTRKTFHSWVDGGFPGKSGIQFSELKTKVKPATSLWPTSPRSIHAAVFPEVMAFFLEQHRLVEPLYALEKENKLDGRAPSEEGKAFFRKQFLAGGQMLGNLWYTAWKEAPVDTYLRGRLLDRQTKQAPAQ